MVLRSPNGTNYKLYIDGIPVQSAVSGTNPIENTANCFFGAMDQSTGNQLIILTDGWMNFAFGKWN
jgi:hypothetical protein